MTEAGRATIVVDTDLKKLNQGLNQAKKNTLSFGKIAETALGFGVANAAMRATTAVKNFFVSSISLAIDAEETFSKFNVVFETVGNNAEKVAEALQEDFNLASVTSKRLLADTGDLLVGFGFTEQAALDLSDQTQRLAGDLASFTNIQGGADRASRILTRGLLGERESLKTLGIAILEADINQRLMEKGQSDLTGEALRQAKAIATLEIAMEQSGKALGDYGRTADSAANVIKTLGETWIEFQTVIGTEIAPKLVPVVEYLTETIKFWSDQIEGMSKVEFGKKAKADVSTKYASEQFEEGNYWEGLKASLGILPEEIKENLDIFIDNYGKEVDKQVEAIKENTDATETNTDAIKGEDIFGSKGTSYIEAAYNAGKIRNPVDEKFVYEERNTT